MVKSAPRVLIARFWHESNGFNPKTTQEGDFQICEGQGVLVTAATSGSTLAGIIQRLRQDGVELIPSLSATAPPSGLVDHSFYLRIKEQLIADAVAQEPDAIALELHGAMGTTLLEDGEGDLLSGLRAAVGDRVPIGIGLDLHAHVTDAMLEAADICIACKENPHSDVVECGEKVAACLLATLDGRLHPVTTMAKVPMILPGAAETAHGPLHEIHEKARLAEARDAAVWDISLFNVFRYVDDEDIGQAAVILSDRSGKTELAKSLAQAFWDERACFTDELVSVGEALSMVAAAPDQRPFVLADMGDRVLAGAPGDSTAIVAAALERGDGLRGAIPITDAQAVKVAFEAGVGNPVCCAVGGRITPGFAPLAITGRVVHLSDGEFILAGPFQGGEPGSMGPTAVIEVDERLALVVTTRAAFSHDPAVFTSQHIDLNSRDFFVAKSGYHFKLNFGGETTPVMVRSPGVGYYTKGALTYHKARFWPEDELSDPLVRARIFRSAWVPAASERRAG